MVVLPTLPASPDAPTRVEKRKREEEEGGGVFGPGRNGLGAASARGGRGETLSKNHQGIERGENLSYNYHTAAGRWQRGATLYKN